MGSKNRIVVVDDEISICGLLNKILKKDYDVVMVNTGEAALNELEAGKVDLVLLDQNLPGCGGIETLEKIKQLDDKIPVIMMTAYGKIEFSVKAIKLGAYDYVEKPFDPDKLKIVVSNAVNIRNLSREVALLRSELIERYSFRNIIGKSQAMQGVYQLISSVSDTDIPVLITGESGTGKELAARAIHYGDNYKNIPFVPINCAAIPDHLLESELFGYEKGAFSGATTVKKGKVELADGGTLFLDEIGDMAENTQAKLLRFIQDGTFERLGGLRSIQVNVRIISATNKDIEWLIDEGLFRKDLYYRINGVQIELPTLESRKEDIPILIDSFIEKYNFNYGDKVKNVESDAMKLLLNYNWPGNIRELESTIQSAIILSKNGTIDTTSLPKRIVKPKEQTLSNGLFGSGLPFELRIEETEKSLIKGALDQSGNNRTKAAKLLQMSLRNLQYKIKKYGI